jgi:hypothetical protein
MKEIPKYPGYYADRTGNIFSFKSGRWRQLKQGTMSRGYKSVTIMKGKRPESRLVHCLILETFKGPCPPGMQARHFPDSDRTNNRLSNLSWSTPEINQADRKYHGTCNSQIKRVWKSKIKRAAKIKELLS